MVRFQVVSIVEPWSARGTDCFLNLLSHFKIFVCHVDQSKSATWHLACHSSIQTPYSTCSCLFSTTTTQHHPHLYLNGQPSKGGLVIWSYKLLLIRVESMFWVVFWTLKLGFIMNTQGHMALCKFWGSWHLTCFNMEVCSDMF